jgi:hypothetical protein
MDWSFCTKQSGLFPVQSSPVASLLQSDGLDPYTDTPSDRQQVWLPPGVKGVGRSWVWVQVLAPRPLEILAIHRRLEGF